MEPRLFEFFEFSSNVNEGNSQELLCLLAGKDE